MTDILIGSSTSSGYHWHRKPLCYPLLCPWNLWYSKRKTSLVKALAEMKTGLEVQTQDIAGVHLIEYAYC